MSGMPEFDRWKALYPNGTPEDYAKLQSNLGFSPGPGAFAPPLSSGPAPMTPVSGGLPAAPPPVSVTNTSSPAETSPPGVNPASGIGFMNNPTPINPASGLGFLTQPTAINPNSGLGFMAAPPAAPSPPPASAPPQNSTPTGGFTPVGGGFTPNAPGPTQSLPPKPPMSGGGGGFGGGGALAAAKAKEKSMHAGPYGAYLPAEAKFNTYHEAWQEDYDRNVRWGHKIVASGVDEEYEIKKTGIATYRAEEQKKQDWEEVERTKIAKMQMNNEVLAAEVRNQKLDSGRLWSNIGVGNQITAAIGVAFSGIGAAFSNAYGGKETSHAMGIIEKAVERDIYEQQVNMQNKKESLTAARGMFHDYVGAFKDQSVAKDAYLSHVYARISQDVAVAAADTDNRLHQNNLEGLRLELEHMAEEHKMRFQAGGEAYNKDMAQKEINAIYANWNAQYAKQQKELAETRKFKMEILKGNADSLNKLGYTVMAATDPNGEPMIVDANTGQPIKNPYAGMPGAGGGGKGPTPVVVKKFNPDGSYETTTAPALSENAATKYTEKAAKLDKLNFLIDEAIALRKQYPSGTTSITNPTDVARAKSLGTQIILAGKEATAGMNSEKDWDRLSDSWGGGDPTKIDLWGNPTAAVLQQGKDITLQEYKANAEYHVHPQFNPYFSSTPGPSGGALPGSK
jgi:hypothetical protein